MFRAFSPAVIIDYHSCNIVLNLILLSVIYELRSWKTRPHRIFPTTFISRRYDRSTKDGPSYMYVCNPQQRRHTSEVFAKRRLWHTYYNGFWGENKSVEATYYTIAAKVIGPSRGCESYSIIHSQSLGS